VDEEPAVWVKLENKGEVSITNIIVYVEEENGKEHFHDSFITLRSNSEKSVRLELTGFEEGSHYVKVKAVSGNHVSGKYLAVNVHSQGAPVSMVMNVKESSDGSAYIIEYDVSNTGFERLEKLFVTVEDVPESWSVVSPPLFDLDVGESASMELILDHGNMPDANVTIALYSNDALLVEEHSDLRLDRIRGVTGMLLSGGSLGWGLLFLLVIGVIYLVYDYYQERKARKNKEIGVPVKSKESPSWWPFG
ncbi:hypothetical protein K8R43_06640, partial [archaeon]|nr:hypothetical protein [archaeon]